MGGMPRRVSRRILQRCAEGRTVVVVPRDGLPSRVYDIDSYRKTVEQAKQIKPWMHRGRSLSPDPLGAVRMKVLRPVRRAEMYE